MTAPELPGAATGDVGGSVAPVSLCDVTLRDGEQSVDAAFTPDEKLTIAAELDRLGVHQIQVGFPRHDGATVTRLIKGAGLGIPVELLCVAFSQAWRADIDVAIDAGADVVHLLMRASDDLLQRSNMSRDEALERTHEAVGYARSHGADVITYGTSFSTQADPRFLEDLVRAADAAGADRVVFSDTIGTARPSAVNALVRSARSYTALPIGIHCHNDFGLAVACTLAAVEGGATWADVSVNGIGERSGNAALEQVVLALRHLYGCDVAIQSAGLYGLSRLVSSILRVPVPNDRPVVGDNSFAQKLDIHVMVSSVEPELMEPFAPASVGNRRRLRLGKGSGPHAVRTKLSELGVTPSDECVASVVAEVQRLAEVQKHHVTTDDLLGIVRRLAPQRGVGS